MKIFNILGGGKRNSKFSLHRHVSVGFVSRQRETVVCRPKKVGDILESKFRDTVVTSYHIVDSRLFITKNATNKLDRKEE